MNVRGQIPFKLQIGYTYFRIGLQFLVYLLVLSLAKISNLKSSL